MLSQLANDGARKPATVHAMMSDATLRPALHAGMGVSEDQCESIYHGLATGAGRFRLLHLNSEEIVGVEEIISCTLKIADFDNAPQYDAVSYTWGNASQMKPIVINGEAVTIRAHLWEILFRLRSRRWDCPLFVDALCIRQDSVDDKNDQVGKIGRIFAQAQHVLAWLGPDADDSQHLARLLAIFDDIRLNEAEVWVDLMDRLIEGTEDHNVQLLSVNSRKEILKLAGWEVDTSAPLYARLLRDVEISRPDLKEDPTAIEDEVELLILRHKFQESFLKFMGRSYFFRTWIRQEIIFAQQVYWFCGDVILSEAAFWPGAQFVIELMTHDCENISFQQDDELGGFWVQQKLRSYLHENAVLNCQEHRNERNACIDEKRPWGIDLATLLRLSEQTSCMDPRDKIYALHGLLHPDEALSKMLIDYGLSSLDFFQQLLPHCAHGASSAVDGQQAFDLGRALQIRSHAMLEGARFSDSKRKQLILELDDPRSATSVAGSLKLLGAVREVVTSQLHEKHQEDWTDTPKRRYQQVKAIRYSWGSFCDEVDTYDIDTEEKIQVADHIWQFKVGSGIMVISRPKQECSKQLGDSLLDIDIMSAYREQVVYGTIALVDEDGPHEGQHEECFDCSRQLIRHEVQDLMKGLTIDVSGDLPISCAFKTAPLLEQRVAALNLSGDRQNEEDDGDEDHRELEEDEDYDEDYDEYDDDEQESHEEQVRIEPSGLLLMPFELFAAVYAHGMLLLELFDKAPGVS